jgi:putative hydrolase of the HAD superfamily
MPGRRRLPRAASQPTQDLGVAVEAIIFDWGGTLTPWHSVDHKALWHAVCEGHFPAGQAAQAALAILTAGSP